MNPAKELNTIEPQALQQVTVTPATLLSLAVQQGADLDRLQQLMDLQDRWDANQARKAYVQAMAEFKANPPEIFKTKQVEFGTTKYKHATIGDVTVAIIDGLSAHGLSHRWDIDQSSGIKVTCVLTHRMGHSESTVMQAMADKSGGKNEIQAIASTITYLQRYTLLAATGLATQDMTDDDGKGSDSPEKITEDQANTINAKITDNELSMPKFLAWLKGAPIKAGSIPEINAKSYADVIATLDASIKKKESK